MDQRIEDALDNLRSGLDRERNFKTVFNHFFPRVFQFLKSKGLPEEDARELTQDVLFSVYNNVGQLASSLAFQGWLFTIARNAMSNWLERQHAIKRGSGVAVLSTSEDLDFADLRVDIGGNLLERERAELLREALDQLPPQMRQCVRIRILEDADYPQIAGRLGISVNTVKAHLFQAKRSLRYRLGSLLQEAEPSAVGEQQADREPRPLRVNSPDGAGNKG